MLWQFRGAPGDEAGVVAADGMVYACGAAGDYGNCDVYALDAATGKLAWRTTGRAGTRPYAAGSGAVYGFKVVDSGASTWVVALSAASGHRLWYYDAGRLLDNAKVGTLAYGGGKVYVGAGSSEDMTAGVPAVLALDAGTGSRAWAASFGSIPVHLTTLAGNTIYSTATTSSTGTRVVAVSGATGRRLWESAGLGEMFSTPVVARGVVCVSAGGLSGLDGATGARIWHAGYTEVPVMATSGVVLCTALDIGAAGTSPAESIAVDAHTGRPLWKRTLAPAGQASAANGVFYVATGTGTTLAGVAAATGQTLWTRPLGAQVADAAVAGGVVYALDTKGNVYAMRA